MKTRRVIINMDNLLDLFKDYLGESEIPSDAYLRRVMLRASDRKFAFVIESPSIPADAKPVMVNFEIRRIFTV